MTIKFDVERKEFIQENERIEFNQYYLCVCKEDGEIVCRFAIKPTYKRDKALLKAYAPFFMVDNGNTK